MFHAAIFDMDGLLIDSERTIMKTWQKVAEELGEPISDSQYVSVIGVSAKDSDAIFSTLLGQELFNRAKKEVNSLLSNAEPRDIYPLKPGVNEMLSLLWSRNIPCAVASSTAKDEVRKRLSSVGILKYFPVVVGGDMVLQGKPDPALYLLASKRLQKAPHDCLAFEDSDNGVLSAVAAGMSVVLIPDIKEPASLSLAGCFEKMSSMEEAVAHVDLWFPYLHEHA